MQSHYYLIDNKGNLRFTPRGIESLAPYFSKAGINIHQITTLESYLTARRQAAPYFLEWLTDKVSDLPLSDESSLLMQLISLDTDTFDKALSDHLAS